MKKSRLWRIITEAVTAGCLGIYAYSAYRIFDYEIMDRRSAREHEDIEALAARASGTGKNAAAAGWSFTHASWKELAQLNPDFVGYLHFDSGLISQPLVKGTDNEYYLSHSFKGNKDPNGTVFLDYLDDLADANLTVYGHYVYADESKMFSPLAALVKQANYQANKQFRVYYEDKEAVYQIVYVYYFNVADYKDYDYTTRNFANAAELGSFLQYPRAHNEIDTEGDLQYGDRFLTLQTCVRYNDAKRLIVLAKEISRTSY